MEYAELLRLNPNAARNLKPGDAIRLPDAPSQAPAPRESRPAAGGSTFHAVARGETVFSIAQRYGVTVEELRKWNGLKGNAIRRGQRLWVSPR